MNGIVQLMNTDEDIHEKGQKVVKRSKINDSFREGNESEQLSKE